MKCFSFCISLSKGKSLGRAWANDLSHLQANRLLQCMAYLPAFGLIENLHLLAVNMQVFIRIFKSILTKDLYPSPAGGQSRLLLFERAPLNSRNAPEAALQIPQYARKSGQGDRW